jgi:hypothetical protein
MGRDVRCRAMALVLFLCVPAVVLVSVRDPLAAVLLDGGVERDPQAVAGVAVGGELVV